MFVSVGLICQSSHYAKIIDQVILGRQAWAAFPAAFGSALITLGRALFGYLRIIF